MLKIIQSIYSRLSGDSALVALLHSDGPGLPAIHHEWGPHNSGPYIVLLWLPVSVVADDTSQATLQVSIFDTSTAEGSSSYLTCIEIRDRVVMLLDRFKDLTGEQNIRSFQTGENSSPEESGRIRQYDIQFTVRFSRTSDI